MFKRSIRYRITNSSFYPFLQFTQYIEVAITSTNPEMTTVFHAMLNVRFINVRYNLR